MIHLVSRFCLPLSVRLRATARPVLTLGLAWALGMHLVPAALAADPPALDTAKQLLREGRPGDAYDILESALASAPAGAEYHHLMGIAALDAGRPGLAVFALERALGLDPDALATRAELGRALLALGEPERAAVELQAVLVANPPAEVRGHVERLLARARDEARVATAERAPRTWSGYIEAELGHDSNFTSGPSTNQVALPAFGSAIFLIPTLATGQSGTFAGAGAGLYYQTRVSAFTHAFFGGNLRFSAFPSGTDWNTTTSQANAGLRWADATDEWMGAIYRYDNHIGSFHTDRIGGGLLRWQHVVSSSDRAGLFAQYSEADRPVDRRLDTRQTLLGLSWQHALGRADATLSFSAYAGREQDRQDNPLVARDLWGLRVGGDMALSGQLRLVGLLGYTRSQYDGVSFFFMDRRLDRRYDLSLSLPWQFARNWVVTPQLQHVRNDSNFPINDYDRTIASVAVRYAF